MVEGTFFDPGSSRRQAAQLALQADQSLRIMVASHDEMPARELVFAVRASKVSARVGNIPRRIEFEDGSSFETPDNAAIDSLLPPTQRPERLAHWLEERWPIAVLSLLGVALITFGFIVYGLPAAADLAAKHLPVAVDRAIGSQTLALLDRTVLEQSRLTAPRQGELTRRFDTMTSGLDDGHEYQLRLRRSPALGPNALALPSGIVVMTDELVALAEHDEELVAVLAHEIGHVRGRHALRHLLQTAGVAAIAAAVLGDVSSASSIVAAAPALIQAKHSRDFEREADVFARAWLADNGIAASRFDDILCRMLAETDAGPAGVERYLATHPDIEERARCTPESTSPATNLNATLIDPKSGATSLLVSHSGRGLET